MSKPLSRKALKKLGRMSADAIGKLVLKDAFALIRDPRAWCQNDFDQHRTYETSSGPRDIKARCLDQAIVDAAEAYGGEVAAEHARKRVYRHFRWKNPDHDRIYSWNDHVCRKHAHVLKLEKKLLAA